MRDEEGELLTWEYFHLWYLAPDTSRGSSGRNWKIFSLICSPMIFLSSSACSAPNSTLVCAISEKGGSSIQWEQKDVCAWGWYRSHTVISFGIIHSKKTKAIMLILIHIEDAPRNVQRCNRWWIEETHRIATWIFHLSEFLFHVGSIVFEETDTVSTIMEMHFFFVPMYWAIEPFSWVSTWGTGTVTITASASSNCSPLLEMLNLLLLEFRLMSVTRLERCISTAIMVEQRYASILHAVRVILYLLAQRNSARPMQSHVVLCNQLSPGCLACQSCFVYPTVRWRDHRWVVGKIYSFIANDSRQRVGYSLRCYAVGLG